MSAPGPSRPGVWNIANALTGVRVALVPVFGVMLLNGGDRPGWRIAALALFVLAALTDRLDGDLARRRRIVTDVGKIADPIADKALMGMALVGLSWLGELPWWVTALVLTREVGVTALRFWVIRYGVIAASPGGKTKTMLQTVAIGVYLLPLGGPVRLAAEVVMLAALVVTVVTGLDYVVRAVRLRRGARSESAGR